MPRTPPKPMSRSAPVSVSIPAIAVDAKIIPVGVNAGGTVAVPPLSRSNLAGWYERGSTPGERGPAVLIGHVDAASVGPAVFYRLGELRPGHLISVTRADQRVAVYRVDSVVLYPKSSFPTNGVYGFTERPTLRLVTCGGSFDEHEKSYRDNVVVFATYVGQHAA